MTEQTRARCVSVHESEVMEWRSDKPPVAPFRDDEFSALVTAVAALEAVA